MCVLQFGKACKVTGAGRPVPLRVPCRGGLWAVDRGPWIEEQEQAGAVQLGKAGATGSRAHWETGSARACASSSFSLPKAGWGTRTCREWQANAVIPGSRSMKPVGKTLSTQGRGPRLSLSGSRSRLPPNHGAPAPAAGCMQNAECRMQSSRSPASRGAVATRPLPLFQGCQSSRRLKHLTALPRLLTASLARPFVRPCCSVHDPTLLGWPRPSHRGPCNNRTQ